MIEHGLPFHGRSCFCFGKIEYFLYQKFKLTLRPIIGVVKYTERCVINHTELRETMVNFERTE